ncbi:MAG: hypothetical protein P0Y58_18455 [Candidatus Pseudomonas phytovorans]|uniref:Uncharacterized protein n=1 Tax=Candidatus Pseudomonas phytovorans TaxID=3121377 RepID=A0AAJ5WEC2_9PSED|nr:hypothetical protein [Pseudomonas sp.]WEK28883.1 MAG: hypothetical protein P0Y58_18455 [Pseudomonas sp.]
MPSEFRARDFTAMGDAINCEGEEMMIHGQWSPETTGTAGVIHRVNAVLKKPFLFQRPLRAESGLPIAVYSPWSVKPLLRSFPEWFDDSEQGLG